MVAGLALGLAVFLAAKFWPAFVRPPNDQSPQTATSNSPTAASAKVISLQYRIIRRSPGGEVKSLASGESLREGDRIHFEFDMPFEGAFYLFYEDRDGSMVWANPERDGSPQTGEAGNQVRVPEKNEITMGAGAGLQNYLAVYVPAAAQWSLKEAVFPDEVKIRPGRDFADARIPSAMAARIKNDLSQKATSVTFPGNQIAGSFLLQLTEPIPSTRLLFHRVTLSQEAQPATQ